MKLLVLIFSFCALAFSAEESFQLWNKEYIKKIQNNLPKIKDEELVQILKDPSSFWYDRETMHSVYQDAIDSRAGLRKADTKSAGLIDPNNTGAYLDITDGLFKLPFKTTAGLHAAPHTNVVKVIWRPLDDEGHRLPIVYYERQRPTFIGASAYGARMINIIDWMFPIGTKIVEVIWENDPSPKVRIQELRTMERDDTFWRFEAIRPYTTAENYKYFVEDVFPNWKSDAELKRFHDHLEKNDLVREDLEGSFNLVKFVGGKDVLPFLSMEKVNKLMDESVFSSWEGEPWKQSGNLKCYAPTTSVENYHIVPRNYLAHAVAPITDSCMKCHHHAGRPLGHFTDKDQYGELYGSSEGVFSFHVFSEQSAQEGYSNNRSRDIRPDFLRTGMVEKYDPNKHKAPYYKKMDRSWLKLVPSNLVGSPRLADVERALKR